MLRAFHCMGGALCYPAGVSGSLPAPLIRPWIPIAGVVAAALLLRLAGLESESLWIDEVGTYNAAAQPTFADFVRYLTYHERTPPLFYLALRGWLSFSATLWWARALSALVGTVSVWAVFVLAARSLERRVALVAAVAVALAPYHLWYSQELRSYILQFLGIALATGGLAWWVRDPQNAKAPQVYIIGTVVALGSGYASLFVAAAHVGLLVWAGWTGRVPRRWALVAGVTAHLLALPFLSLLGWHLSAQGNFSPPPPAATTPFAVACHFAAGVYYLAPDWLVAVGAICGCVLFAWGCGDVDDRVRPAAWRWSRDAAVRVWALSTLVPAGLLFAVSCVRPLMMEGERYMIIALPGALVVAARGLVLLRLVPRALLASLLLALVAATLAPQYGSRQKLPWADVADYIRSQHRDGDCAATIPLYDVEVLEFYLGDRLRLLGLDPAHPEEDLARQAHGAPGVWLASILSQTTPLDAALENRGWRAVETMTFVADRGKITLTLYRPGG